MSDEEVEKIAKGLSAAGLEAFDWVRPHSIIASYRPGAAEIVRKGLVTQEGSWLTLTDLGKAVRALLTKENEG